MGFLQIFESFRGKIYKKYSIGNEEWIEFETAKITRDYIVHNHLSISYAQLQTKRMHILRKNEQYFYFSFTLKDTEIFLSYYFEATLE